MPQVPGDSLAPSLSGVILLVEDNPAVSDVARMLLEDEGFAVTAIADGGEAVSWAERHEPALVVLDVGLPSVDGVALASILRARYGPLLPILIFSADERAYAKTRHLGPFGLIRKPFDADVLITAVRRGLAGSSRFDASSDSPPGRASLQPPLGDDMPATNGDATVLADELRGQLNTGALDGLGPVTLLAGPFTDAGLAGRTLLADVDHLSSLAEHTGDPPTPDRWALLADDLYVLLLKVGRRRDGTINGLTLPTP
jgi:CheY-like chemotaxis protein